jgi:hypothetical protein
LQITKLLQVIPNILLQQLVSDIIFTPKNYILRHFFSLQQVALIRKAAGEIKSRFLFSFGEETDRQLRKSCADANMV